MSKELDDLLNNLTDESIDDEYEEDSEEESNYQSPMNLPVEYEEQKSSFNGNEDIVKDYKHSRNTLYGLIDRGQRALEHALKVATETEHPRSLEVANGLLKNIADISKQLVDLQKVLKDLEQEGESQPHGNVTNNYYVGDGELSKILDMVDGECKDITPPQDDE